MNSEALEQIDNSFRKYLRSVGSNYSHARSVVVRTLLRAEKPVSVMELLYSAKEEDPLTVALQTIYNTMRLMVACGLAKETISADGVTVYTHQLTAEKCKHPHLACKDCGQVIDEQKE